jgi:spermidine synthase
LKRVFDWREASPMRAWPAPRAKLPALPAGPKPATMTDDTLPYPGQAATQASAAEPDAPLPFIRETQGMRSLHFAAAEIQSRMSLLAPDALDLEYTRMMMGFLMFNSQPERIGMIGLGGGSLAKFCHRHLPRCAIEVVEIDADVIALRDRFSVPRDDARFRVLAGDGADYVRACAAAASAASQPDILLVDGFDRSGVPPQLCSQAFYDDCHGALREGGIMTVNLHVNHPLHDSYVDRIRDCFGHAVFEVVDDDMTNSIVFACKGDRFDEVDRDRTLRPGGIAKDAWRQLMPTFKVIAATLTLR